MHSKLSRCLSLLAPAVIACAAGAQPIITPVVVQFDLVPSVGGLISRIDGLAVNNSGTWLVEADTTATDTNADQVLLRGGLDPVFGVENQPLLLPAGAAISSFDSVQINNHGDTGWNLFLRNLTTSTDSGVFFNFDLVLQESTVSGSPVFAPPTPYIGFFEVRMNDQNRFMVMASVDDPSIASTVDRAIVYLDYDPGAGTYTETVAFKEGDVLPGQVQPVADFGTGAHSIALNSSGTPMFVADLTGDTLTDGVVYIGDTPVAQEGQPSIVPGRNWRTLSTTTRLDLNDRGEGVWNGTLDGDTATDLVIVTSTRKVIQEGDTLPAIGGVFTFTGFGTGPLHIDDVGHVLWFGDWNDPDTTRDTGLFLDDRLLLQEGVTVVDVRGTPMTVQAVASVESATAMSDNGRFILAEVTLLDGAGTAANAALLIDLGDDACPVDFNADGELNADDLSDYITCFFGEAAAPGSCPQANFNGDGNIDADDLSDYITAYFAGC